MPEQYSCRRSNSSRLSEVISLSEPNSPTPRSLRPLETYSREELIREIQLRQELKHLLRRRETLLDLLQVTSARVNQLRAIVRSLTSYEGWPVQPVIIVNRCRRRLTRVAVKEMHEGG